MLDSFKINQIVDIEVEEGLDYSGNYRTRVEDIKEDCLVLGMPMEKSQYIPLRPGSDVIVWHWDNSASQALYCKVKERLLEPLPLIFIEWPPYKIKKIQRRGYVRVPVNINLEYVLDNDSDREDTFQKVLV